MKQVGYDITPNDINFLIHKDILIDEIDKEIHIPLLDHINQNREYTTQILIELGTQLGKMTKMRFNHGELDPSTIFYNKHTNSIKFLIPQNPIRYNYEEKQEDIKSIFKEAFLDLKDTFENQEKIIFEGFKVGFNLKIEQIQGKLH